MDNVAGAEFENPLHKKILLMRSKERQRLAQGTLAQPKLDETQWLTQVRLFENWPLTSLSTLFSRWKKS